MASQSPDYIVRRIKSILLTGALEEIDPVINFLSRGVLRTILTEHDLEQIKGAYLKLSGSPSGNEIQAADRAYLLYLETRDYINPQSYTEAIISDHPKEIQALTQRLSNKSDPASLSLLTYLLANKAGNALSATALCRMGREGIGHLLNALYDPLADVQFGAAQILQFCHLPMRYARKTRQILREHKVRAVEGTDFILLWEKNNDLRSNQAYLGCLTAFSFVFGLGITWIAVRLIGFDISFSYFLQFSLYKNPSNIIYMTKMPINEMTISNIERGSFEWGEIQPTESFWLARGRLLRALRKPDLAIICLNKGLALNPFLSAIRFELALANYLMNKLEYSRNLLEAERGRYLRENQDFQTLHKLILIESESKYENLENRNIQIAQLLAQLHLWDKALPLVLELIKEGYVSSDIYWLLYQCYSGKGFTARALFAALMNDKQHDSKNKVSGVDADNLRWIHRLEKYPPELTGKLGFYIDTGQDDKVIEVLKTEGLITFVGTELSLEKLNHLADLPRDIQREVPRVFERLGDLLNARRIDSALGREGETLILAGRKI